MRRSSHRCGATPMHGGFTLIEVLVVMSLLSLVMLAMGSALRTTAQTEERVDQRLQRIDEMRVGSDFLRSILGRVSARKMAGPVAVGENQFIFSGNKDDLTWIGIMPARYGVGGRYHFRLALETTTAGKDLVVRFAPWLDDMQPVNWPSAEMYKLVTNVTELGLQYEDAQAEPPMWTTQWTNPEQLPQRVMVSLQTVQGPWPELVFAMRIAPGSDPASSGAVFGGSR